MLEVSAWTVCSIDALLSLSANLCRVLEAAVLIEALLSILALLRPAYMAQFTRFPLQANAGHSSSAHIHAVLEGALGVEAAQVTEARTAICFHFIIVVVRIDI